MNKFSGLEQILVVALVFVLMFTIHYYVSRPKSQRIATKDAHYNKLPLIRMAFSNREFALKETHDMGGYWLLIGYITGGGIPDEPDVSFRVPKGIRELRLSLENWENVLIDISDPNDKRPCGYIANKDRVWTGVFPFPEP